MGFDFILNGFVVEQFAQSKVTLDALLKLLTDVCFGDANGKGGDWTSDIRVGDPKIESICKKKFDKVLKQINGDEMGTNMDTLKKATLVEVIVALVVVVVGSRVATCSQ